MQIFRVALLQMTAGSSQEENRRKGLDWCRRAKAMGADLALFPEMWNTGYAMTEDEQALRQSAIGRDSGFVRAFQEAAKELNMAVAITYLERYDPLPRNTVTLFDRFGKPGADLCQGAHLRF